jgi:hypothetical protein
MYTFVDSLYRARKLFASEVAMVSEGLQLTYSRGVAASPAPWRGSAWG